MKKTGNPIAKEGQPKSTTFQMGWKKKSSAMTDLHEIAHSYTSAGLSVIPVGKDKKPLCRWAEFQTHIADDRTLARWFSSVGNIAVVTGKVSGNLVAIDFDEPRFFQAWLEKVGE